MGVASFHLRRVVRYQRVFFVFQRVIEGATYCFVPFFLCLVGLHFGFSSLVFFSTRGVVIGDGAQHHRCQHARDAVGRHVPRGERVGRGGGGCDYSGDDYSRPGPRDVANVFLHEGDVHFFHWDNFFIGRYFGL